MGWTLGFYPRGSTGLTLNPLLVALETRLLTAAPSSHGVRSALSALQDGHLTTEECARALTPPVAWEESGDQGECGEGGSGSAAWLPAALACVAGGDAGAMSADLIGNSVTGPIYNRVKPRSGGLV